MVYKNFLPVINLPFISKVVGKAALQQLLVPPKFQSGFRKYHSTETALLKVQNDILMSMANKAVKLLVLLDSSFLSISLPSMVMLTTPRFIAPSDLSLSIPKLTLSLRLRCALLMFVLGLLLIV